MRKITILLLCLFVIFPMTDTKASSTIDPSQMYIFSNDGKVFLGTLSLNTYDSNSIFNQYGNHGSKYSSTSIYNTYGTYGSRYSTYSAYNPYTSTPPVLVYQGKIRGYVTTNKYLSSQFVSPANLWNFAKGF